MKTKITQEIKDQIFQLRKENLSFVNIGKIVNVSSTTVSNTLYPERLEKSNRRSKEYYHNNKEYFKNHHEKYYEQNKEKILEYSSKYHKENKDHYKNIHRQWKENNIERNEQNIEKWKRENLEYWKVWREKYPEKYETKKKDDVEKYKLQRKQYQKNNKERINKNNSLYNKKKRAENIQFKILTNLRHRLWCSFKGLTKSQSTLDLLGCSIEKALKYIESKFLPDMTWENYGMYGWHIDHIRPLSSLNLIDPEEQKKACHYSNLQPLWAEDNLSKGAKY